MRATIVGLRGSYKGRTAPLYPGMITIGRSPSNSLAFPNDTTLSREHAVLSFKGDKWLCWDVGSTNGTFINGVQIGSIPVAVPPGSEVAFGEQAIQLNYTTSLLDTAISAITNVFQQERVPPQNVQRNPTSTKPPVDTKTGIDSARWYGWNSKATLHSFNLSSPLCFIGERLVAPRRTQYGSLYTPEEPSLINPNLAVTNGNPDPLPYYPNYKHISPSQRWQYLSWLQGGRTAPIDQGYLFLFLYGIERYVAQNSPTRADAVAVMGELTRLVESHEAQDYGSFTQYSFNLISAEWTYFPELISETVLNTFGRCSDTDLLWMLACLASHQMDFTSAHAMHWFRSNAPRMARWTLWHRCEEELSQLFLLRYVERFGDRKSLRCSASERTRSYYPSNESLRGNFNAPFNAREAEGDLAFLEGIKLVLSSCIIDLQPYGRSLLQSPKSLKTLAQLPGELALRNSDIVSLHRLFDELNERGQRVLGWGELISRVGLADDCSDKSLRALSCILAKMGYLMEPDPGFWGKYRKGMQMIAIGLAATSPEPLEDTTILSPLMVARICGWLLAQSQVPRDCFLEAAAYISSSFNAEGNVKERIQLVMELCAVEPAKPTPNEVYLITADLHKHAVSLFVQVVRRLGNPLPKVLRELARIAGLLGVDSEQISAELFKSEGAIPLVKRATSSSGYAIPPPPPERSTVQFDETRLKRKQEESESARALLSGILGDEPTTADEEFLITRNSSVRYAKILNTLQAGQQPKASFDATCRSAGWIAGQARAELNELAFEVAGYALIEGDDPLTVDTECLEILRNEYADPPQ